MSDSKASSSVPPRLNRQFLPVGQMRDYQDEAALARVWNRLESRRRRSSAPGPLVQVFAAAALLITGVGMGMFIEHENMSQRVAPLASSELIVDARAPAGLVSESVSMAQVSTPTPVEQEDARGSISRPQKSRGSRRRARGQLKRIPQIVSGGEEVLANEGTPVFAVPGELDGTNSLAELTVAPPPVVVAQTPSVSWLELADRGEFAAAFQALDESGGFDAVLSAGSSEELMGVVEVARFVGQQGRAIQALKVVTQRHGGDANAPLAAMILGNLLSSAGDAAGAAEAYALNRSLSPGGDFAEDALVREFDMASSDGDLPLVERLRAQYEAEFPEGRHIEDMRAEEARLISLVVAPQMERSGKKEKAKAKDSAGQDQAAKHPAPDAAPSTDADEATEGSDDVGGEKKPLAPEAE